MKSSLYSATSNNCNFRGYVILDFQKCISVVAHTVIDHLYCLQVIITTPTSSATGYYLLPNWDDSEATVSVEPTEVSFVMPNKLGDWQIGFGLGSII
jgi:hypothetical protein